MDWLLVSALIRAVRVLAVVTAVMVVIDSCGILLSVGERPPHRPRANALAWLVAAGAIASAGFYLLSHRYVFVTAADPLEAQIVTGAMWVLLSVAFTLRAITRAYRPGLVVLSVVLMGGFGTALALAEPW